MSKKRTHDPIVTMTVGQCDVSQPNLKVIRTVILRLQNKRAGLSMDLGSTGTVTPAAGATQKTSAASMVMFGNDKKRHVIGNAP